MMYLLLGYITMSELIIFARILFTIITAAFVLLALVLFKDLLFDKYFYRPLEDLLCPSEASFVLLPPFLKRKHKCL